MPHRLTRHPGSGRWLVLLALFLSSCYPLKHPLVDPEKAKPDSRLYGVWKCLPRNKEDRTGYANVFMGASGDNYAPAGLMKAVWVEYDPRNNTVKADTFYFFQASIGQAGYMNVVDNAKPSANGFVRWDKSTSKYFLVKYVLGDDRLTLQLMNLTAAEKAVTAGQLKGTITERGILKLKDTEITEDGQGLQRFLEGGGDKLLFADSEKLVLIKTK